MGPNGVNGLNGKDANVKSLGYCIDSASEGTTYYVQEILPAHKDENGTLQCLVGHYVNMTPTTQNDS